MTEFKKFADVHEGHYALFSGEILQVIEITPTDWDQSRNYYCSDGHNHERNINSWTAVADRIPEGYADPHRDRAGLATR